MSPPATRKKMKETDSSNLPPCQSVLLEKIKRANLVTHMWKNAILKASHTWPPEENGWLLENGHYTIKWFSGQKFPDVITTHINQSLDMMPVDQDNCSSSDESEPDSGNE